MNRQKQVTRPVSMGLLNQKLVLEQTRLHNALSRADIARNTGLSKPSVSRAADVLLRNDLVSEEPPRKNHGKIGKRPKLLRFNTEAAFFQSIDMGGTKLTFGLGNLAGELIREHSVENPGDWNKTVGLISSEIQEVLRDVNLPGRKLGGIAIAVQGVVDMKRGTVSSAPNMSGPDGYPFRKTLEQYLSVPVFLENDVNLAALGEFWKSREEYQNMVYLSIGTAIGGAIIINGTLFRGKDCRAGEIGWLVPDKKYLFGSHGKFGPLESLATGPALTRKAKEMIQESFFKDDLLALNNNITPKAIFDASRRGSTLAKKIVDDWILDLGVAISNISSILNPELVILEGGLSRSGDFFLDKLEQIVKAATQVSPKIRISRLQEKAPLYGGLKICSDYYLEEFFSEQETGQLGDRL